MLCFIQRKKSGPDPNNPVGSNDSLETGALPAIPSVANSDLQGILNDIASIRKHQALISSDLKTLQNANAHLWQEAVESRNRTKRCQETINKILAFLAQVFGGRISDPTHRNRGDTRDNHRPRNGDLSDPRTNLSYSPPSPGGLSLFAQSRLPRLMLEDVQKPTAREPDSVEGGLSSHRISGDEYPGLSRNCDTTGPCLPTLVSAVAEAGGIFDRPGSSPTQVFIDPILEGKSSDEFNSNDNPTNGPDLDQLGTDAVLQALFNENASNGTFNVNDASLPGINWSELLNASESASFGGGLSSPPPSNLTSTSPLRITNGLDMSPSVSPSASPPQYTIPSPPQDNTTFNLQEQVSHTESATKKVESLEAVIERLVGSLPGAIEELPLHSSDNHFTALSTEDSFLGSLSKDKTHGQEAEPTFDTAFLKTLNTEPHVGSPDAAGPCVAPISPVAILTENQNHDQRNHLDLDRILDEWTCEDTDRLDSIQAKSLSSTVPSKSSPNKHGSPGLRSRTASHTTRQLNSITSLNTHREAQKQVIFDLNDDDQFRRMLCKRPVNIRGDRSESLTRTPSRSKSTYRQSQKDTSSLRLGQINQAMEVLQPDLLSKRLLDEGAVPQGGHHLNQQKKPRL